MSALKLWRAVFAALDRQSHWPGPRPLSKKRDWERRYLLAGRERDKRQFVDDVSSHSLVLLHGESGVGKSSLLNIGLIEGLRKNGYHAVIASDWTNTAGREGDPEQLVADLLRSADEIPPGIDLSAGAAGLLEQLDRLYEDRAVLVLDQFEELIRYQPQRFRETVEWVLKIHRETKVRVVLSLRSEYLHHLKPIERGARPFSIARYELAPLDSRKAIIKVITSPNRPDKPEVIEVSAVERLADAWEELDSDSSDRGLLQLQATLYALHARAVGEGRKVVTTGDIDALLEARPGGSSLLAVGFDEAIDLKLQRCAEACKSSALKEALDAGMIEDFALKEALEAGIIDGSELDDALNAVMIEGTSALVRRSVDHLSSGGYKLVRDEWNLAQETLRRELAVLEPTPGEAEAIFTVLRAMDGDGGDYLNASRAAIVLAASKLDKSPDVFAAAEPEVHEGRLGISPAPWQSDPADVSSGAVLGLSPQAVLIEELRRFMFAVEWLTAASFARASTPTPGQTLLTLIHDGFSRALEGWVRRTESGPGGTLARLTAAEGERFSWPDPPVGTTTTGLWPEFGGEDGPRHLVNLRWRNCQVTASFRRVVFVNCDLRGSRFVDCSFEGAVFVNCLLDGASFNACRIIGAPADPVVIPKNQDERDLPSFVLDVSDDLVRTLNRYRETDVATTQLTSITSGVPAIPRTGAVPGEVRWEPHVGGLTMYGGRLSSLMIRRCRFDPDGKLALRHIAGSSLDLVEQVAGRIEVFDSTIRGLSVTRPVGEVLDREHTVHLHIANSALAHAWFGPGLVGSAEINSCVVWQLMNVSEADDFEVSIVGSRFHGVVNVGPIDEDSVPMAGYEERGIADPEELRGAATRMAYRSVPARLELELRARKTGRVSSSTESAPRPM
jgi:hypothetical protein